MLLAAFASSHFKEPLKMEFFFTRKTEVKSTWLDAWVGNKETYRVTLYSGFCQENNKDGRKMLGVPFKVNGQFYTHKHLFFVGLTRNTYIDSYLRERVGPLHQFVAPTNPMQFDSVVPWHRPLLWCTPPKMEDVQMPIWDLTILWSFFPVTVLYPFCWNASSWFEMREMWASSFKKCGASSIGSVGSIISIAWIVKPWIQHMQNGKVQ